MCKKLGDLFNVLFNIIHISLGLFFDCVGDHVDLVQACLPGDYASYCTLIEIIEKWSWKVAYLDVCMLLIDITYMLPKEGELLLWVDLPAALPEKFSNKKVG